MMEDRPFSVIARFVALLNGSRLLTRAHCVVQGEGG